MAAGDRLTRLLAPGQDRVTGIDFVRVDDPAFQDELHVYFLVDPEAIVPSFTTDSIEREQLRITSTSGGLAVAVRSVTYAVGAAGRHMLRVVVDHPGDFSRYRLLIDDARVDRFFNDVEFSFKQACPTDFDCERPPPECPPDPVADVPVDYLARDFESLRSALLDFAAQRYPRWSETITADAGVMIAELLAAVGDELSYVQDRYAREAHFETATMRRSLRRHTRLVDYELFDGRAARTVLDLTVRAGMLGERIAAGSRVWSPAVGGGGPIPFEIGGGLADARAGVGFWVHEDWNAMPVHQPDEAVPCLAHGATELYLRGWFPTAAQVPPGTPNPMRSWLGKLILLRSDPPDPSLPARRHLVTLVELEQTIDPLVIDPATSAPLEITRLRWRGEDALPFELPVAHTVARGNLVPAVAGETVLEHAVVGPGALPGGARRVLEREGPHDARADRRAVTFLHSLLRTEGEGLAWIGRGGDTATALDEAGLPQATPEVELEVVDASLTPLAPPELWPWRRTPLDAGPRDRTFTVEDGTWRRVVGFRQRVGELVHEDLAARDGFTVRFGDGEFGAVPPDGTIFAIRYRTGPGTRANVPPDSVTSLSKPGDPTVFDPLIAVIAAATNPLEVTSGRDPERASTIVQQAPEAYRAITFRAVREEDYREIAERLPWVQRGGARFRWTGSWLSAFVTADPENALALDDERRHDLEELMQCVRQAGREVIVRDPAFVDLDLVIWICIEPGHFTGQVKERVIAALTAGGGFFDPDRFTFGTPLYRAALEAAVQSVPGVLGVELIEVTARGLTARRPFRELALEVAPHQLVRLANDPRFPDRGTLRVEVRRS